MEFEKYIAIDWSGAYKTPTEKIQVAKYDPETQTVSLVRSPTQRAPGRNKWSREEVLRYVQRQIAKRRVLIGFDFAFGYPYCNENAYFPGKDTSPANVQNLWKTVDEFCRANDGRDFYGGQFYRDDGSHFKCYYKYNGFEGDRWAPRLRVTDRQAGCAPRVDPSSVFNCYGQKNVGTGSLAGMRFLRRLQQDTNIAIWPFKTPDPPDCSTVVEIYPSVFLNDAETRRGNQPTPATVRELLRSYGATLADAREEWSGDERDALVSAAGMGCFARQPTTWQAPAGAPDGAATHEGWMFGVQ